MRKRVRSRLTLHSAAAPLIVFWCVQFSFAQSNDPFSIRVESNQVLVRAQVFRKGFRHVPITQYWAQCMNVNLLLSFSPMSEPYIGDHDCLKNLEINDLQTTEFHVFEDGLGQPLSSVVLERGPWTIERDMHNERLASHIPQNDFVEFHRIWSYTPQGIWRSADLSYSSRFSAVYHYRIAYIPKKLQAGACHQVKVSVDRPHTEVVATSRYCYVPHPATDALVGTELGRSMQPELTSHFIEPEIPLFARAGFFYTEGREAKVDVVLQFPFEKLKYRSSDFRGNIGVIGVAYGADGNQIARFSDAAIVPGDLLWGDEWHAREALPSRYETQLDLPAGRYELRLVLSDGSKFGRAVVPVQIEPYDDTKLMLSSIFLFKRYRIAAVAAKEAEKINLAPAYVPLVSQDIEITPTDNPTFSGGGKIPVYFQIYGPGREPAQTVEVNLRIVDAKTGKVQKTFLPFDAAPYREAGTNRFAVHQFLQIGNVAPGEYRLEVQAKDSSGHISDWRGTSLTIQ